MDDVLKALRAATAGGNGHAWARKHGFNYSFVYRVLNGINPPTARMCEALGFRKQVVKATIYERTS